MYRVALLVVALVLVAATAAPAAAQFGVTVVAGQATSGSATVNVNAVQLDFTGFVGGTLRVESAPGFVFVSRVTCIRALADRVLVGGVIVSAPTATVGHTSLVAIRDGGPGTADSMRIAFSITELDTCPVFPLDLFPVSSGNFVVLRI